MNKRLAMVIDQERCLGCDACTIACMHENKTLYHWIQVEKPDLNQKKISHKNISETKLQFLPYLCNHCANPPCKDVCSQDALFKRGDGLVIVRKERCEACLLCIDACPYNVILYNQQKGFIEKCNFCFHRIDKGFEPFCVICCEGQAIHFGNLNDPDDKISHLISKRQSFVLKPEKKTGPSVFYLKPKPKKRLL